MPALPRVGVLVKMRAVETAEAVWVRRKMARNPVEENADPLAVAAIDEEPEVVGVRKPASARYG